MSGIQRFRDFASECEGASGAEYAICIGLVLLAGIVAFCAFGELSGSLAAMSRSLTQSGEGAQLSLSIGSRTE